MKSFNVSVIIPTLNEEKYVGGILSDLCSQTIKPYEVIIGDCGSSDTTVEVAKKSYDDIRIAVSKVKSPGAARNAAANMSSGDVLVFIDADVRIPNNFLEVMVECLKTNKADITYPKFYSDGKSIMGAIHFVIVRLWLLYYRHLFTEKGIGGVIVVTRSAYNKIGGFEENPERGEDVIFYETAHKKRLKIKYCKNTVAYVSSRRTRGFGFFQTLYEDSVLLRPFRIFKKKAPIF